MKAHADSAPPQGRHNSAGVSCVWLRRIRVVKFSNEQRFVLACHWYLSEVNNGGHDQFYDNNTGVVWKGARDGFIAIGAREVAAIIDESSRRLGGNLSLNRTKRQQQLERINPRFDDLDEKVFKLDKRLDFDRKLMEYIRAHRQKFYFSGTVEKVGGAT